MIQYQTPYVFSGISYYATGFIIDCIPGSVIPYLSMHGLMTREADKRIAKVTLVSEHKGNLIIEGDVEVVGNLLEQRKL